MPTASRRVWSKTPDNIGGRICQGSMDCEYEPDGRNGSFRPMTCERVWELYQIALVESFIRANPGTWFHQSKLPCFHPARSIRSAHSICPAPFPQLYRSRYGMVTYTLIPYHLAYHAGKIQDEILTELLEMTSTVEDLDMDKAKELIQCKLSPFLQRHQLSLDRFTF